MDPPELQFSLRGHQGTWEAEKEPQGQAVRIQGFKGFHFWLKTQEALET